MRKAPPTALVALLLGSIAARARGQKPVPAHAPVGDGALPPGELRLNVEPIRTRNARVAKASQQSTFEPQALGIEFERAERPSVLFAPGASPPADWRPYELLVLDVMNPSSDELAFAVRIDDDPAADDSHHSRVGGATLGPNQSASISVPFGEDDPMRHGMRGGPPVPGVQPARSVSEPKIDPSHITGVQIFLTQPQAPRTLMVRRLRLLSAPSYTGIVDRFGQYARTNWPGKLKGEKEFVDRRGDEEGQIRSTNHLPALPGYDEYGGWESGPKLYVTGFFRSEERDGKWWLVTPGGHLFFSLGIDVVSLHEGFTLIDTREEMFAWLPKPREPLANHYGYAEHILRGPVAKGRTYNFYQANLERKYGAAYLDQWRAMALDRVRSWGFNTIGNWSDPKLYERKYVPYTATLHIGGDFARVSSGLDYWGKMPDPFDTKFQAAAEQNIRPIALRLRDDPWCVGYFIDNELSWAGPGGDRGRYGLAYGALDHGPDSPAKRAFVQRLTEHYQEIQKLNEAWGTRLASWAILLDQPFAAPERLPSEMKQDFSAFIKEFARQYFRVARDALRRYDPNHLYLGCRFAWRTPEAVQASAEFCDVVSFNIYDRQLDPRRWEFTKALHKPCIIGEFHFGALDRGMFHAGLVAAQDQPDRARMYRDYVNSVTDHPAFVGCHWFEYVDEPLTGRALDGENYNIGFVDVTDTPYPEMVAAAKRVHTGIYARRAK